ncbi:unnamed protein product [Larinioides sclopetarius]|uniref:Uncharacterized protein n=1 Tax=Larinioides sclopetarius TaxID=280406 RepID=A0AAV2BC50_9ARAC
MEELFLDFCILFVLKIAMAGPIFWNLKPEEFEEHLEGLHDIILGLPDNQQRDIILSCHNLEPEKFAPNGEDLQVDLLKLKRSTLWVVDRKTVIYGREDKPARRPHPVVRPQSVKTTSQTTPPAVLSLPSLQLIFRRLPSSNGVPLYSCQYKDKRMQRLFEEMRRKELEESKDESQEKVPVPSKRKACDAGSSKQLVKKPRLQMMDPRLRRFMNNKPKIIPKKGEDERFKNLILKARLQLEERQKV